MLLASFTVHILYINIFYSVGWKANAVEFYFLVGGKLWFLGQIWHFGLLIFLNCILLSQNF